MAHCMPRPYWLMSSVSEGQLRRDWILHSSCRGTGSSGQLAKIISSTPAAGSDLSCLRMVHWLLVMGRDGLVLVLDQLVNVMLGPVF